MENGELIEPVPHMIKRSVSNYPDKTALMYPVNGEYKHMTYSEMGEEIDRFATGLINLGLDREQIAMDSENRPECAISEYGTMSTKGVFVAVYDDQPPGYVEYVLHDSDASAVIVSKPEEFKKIMDVKGNLPKLKYIFTLEGLEDKKNSYRNTIPFSEVCKLGGKREGYKLDELFNSIDLEDVNKIIYTSGTTGEPKGVELTNLNVSYNAKGCINAMDLNENDTLFLFIPWQHSFGAINQTALHVAGAAVAYSSKKDLLENVKKVKPTIFPGVPVVFEKMKNGILDKAKKKGVAKNLVFKTLTGASMAYHKTKDYKLLRPLNYAQKKIDSLGDKMAYREIREKLGCDNLRFLVSGGAPLKKKTRDFLRAWKLILLEGYGLTEHSPVVAVEREIDIGEGVGKPLDYVGKDKHGKTYGPVLARISGEGELLLKSPSVMKGYRNKPEETEKALKNGWLSTGDIVRINKKGHIIIDYREGFLVLSTGENVPSCKLEKYMNEIPSYKTLVVGHGEKYPAALIFPESRDVKPEEGLIEKHLKGMRGWPNYEQIRRVVIMSNTPREGEELTPTLKVKARVLEEKNRGIIKRLYSRPYKCGIEILYQEDL